MGSITVRKENKLLSLIIEDFIDFLENSTETILNISDLLRKFTG